MREKENLELSAFKHGWYSGKNVLITRMGENVQSSGKVYKWYKHILKVHFEMITDIHTGCCLNHYSNLFTCTISVVHIWPALEGKNYANSLLSLYNIHSSTDSFDDDKAMARKIGYTLRAENTPH